MGSRNSRPSATWWPGRPWSTGTRRAGRSAARGVRCGCLHPRCKGSFSSVAARTPRPWTPCFPRRSSREWPSAMTRRCISDALPGLRSAGRICCERSCVWPFCIRGRKVISSSWIACWRCTTRRSGWRRTVGWARKGGSSESPSSRGDCPICVGPRGRTLRPTCHPTSKILPGWSAN